MNIINYKGNIKGNIKFFFFFFLTDLHYSACFSTSGQDRCFDPMGMQNFEIPDSSITSNSQLSFGTPAHAARLYLTAGNTLDGAWCADKNKTKVLILILICINNGIMKLCLLSCCLLVVLLT